MDAPFLLDQLRRTQDDDPWHGPSMEAVLEHVDALMAGAHPLTGTHSIWEIVLHLTSWNAEVVRRLQTGTAREPADGDWPAVPAPANDEAWEETLDRLRASQLALREAIGAVAPERWGATIGDERDPALGSGVTTQQMLYGVLQHEAYHTGQMAMLAKAMRLDDPAP